MMRFLRYFLIAVAVAVLAVAALDAAIESLVPSGKMAAVCVEHLQERLHRQVRMKAAGIGLWNGLWMEGVSVSEAPGFTAGIFLDAGRIAVRPRLLPLFIGRIEVEDVTVSDFNIRIVRRRDGRFNFSDLAGAAEPEAVSGSADKALQAAAKILTVQVRKAHVRRGEAVYTDPGASLNLLVTDISAWVDGLAARGRTEAHVDFKLKGLHAGKSIEADVAFDTRADLKDFVPASSSGKLTLTKIRHPSFWTDLLRAEWDLRTPSGTPLEAAPGFTPFLSSAEGMFRLDGSAGELTDPAALAKESKWANLLLYPVDVMTRFRGLGLSDLSKIAYSELRGEYSFQSGSVNIAPFYIRGPALSINVEGVIQLRRQSVGLKANLVLGHTAVGVTVEGPLVNPKITPNISFKGPSKKTIEQKIGSKAGRIVKEPIKTLEQELEDAGNIIDKAFR